MEPKGCDVRSLARKASYFTSFKSGLAAAPPIVMLGAIVPPVWPIPFMFVEAGAGGEAPAIDDMLSPFLSCFSAFSHSGAVAA
jgi:hypothetical protein